jgi:hypothetical protein
VGANTCHPTLRQPAATRLRSRPELVESPPILRFSIETYFPPTHAIRRRWSDSNGHPLEAKVGNIIATLLAAGPLLVRIREDRAEQQRRWAKDRQTNRSWQEKQRLESARLTSLFKQAELRKTALWL